MEGSPSDRGMTFRALSSLFEQCRERSVNTTYSISVSLLEVYNEQVRDLLSSAPAATETLRSPRGGMASEEEGAKKLDIRYLEGKTEVVGLTQVPVGSEEEVIKVMEKGNKMRAVGGHNFNERSSRSHMVFTVYCSGFNRLTGKTSSGKLHLIDLAGSERLSKTAATGDRLKEAQAINKSLSALADVITALGGKSKHVPFRNSKLTFVLQDSLEGNSKTLMFVNCSPVAYNSSETKCSLQFAERCRAVALGVAKKNVTSSPTE
jgi:kinesin family protein C2/C3